MHLIPTSSSWLHVIERFFRDLTDKRIRRAAFHNVADLVEAIMDYVAKHNADPQRSAVRAPRSRRETNEEPRKQGTQEGEFHEPQALRYEPTMATGNWRWMGMPRA